MPILRGRQTTRGPILEIGHATAIRWKILALLMALCFISHLNRVSISVAADERLMRQYSISEEPMGVVYSSFLIVYTLFMIPGGAFIDRFGPRRALAAMAFGSGVFGMLTGFTGLLFSVGGQIWATLLIVRSLMGLVTTPLHPASARCVSNWFPAGQRTLANGLVTGAALLGIACTYKLFGALIDHFDWPMAFTVTGGCTIALAAIWSGYATDDPSQHPRANRAEQQFIGDDAVEPSSDREVFPWRWAHLLKNRNLVLLTVSYAAVGYFQYLFFYWIHYYFKEVLRLSSDESRWYAGIPTLVMALSMPLGGWMADCLQRRRGSGEAGKTIPIVGMLASAVCLTIGLMAPDPKWIVAWFALSMGALGLAEGSFWLTAVELGGRHGGRAAAIMNTGGNGIGLLAPMITPAASAYLGWRWGIGLGGLVCVLGAMCWFGIRVQEPKRSRSRAMPPQ